MKFTVEADCTPAEALAFLGLPDITPLNEQLVQEVSSRLTQNAALLKPEELIRTWMSFGGQAQEQFMRMMTAGASLGSTPKR